VTPVKPADLLLAAGSPWIPMVTGDFNADGHPDIMWRHASTGAISVWFMSGRTRVSSTRFYDAATAAEAE
jgi:hypothetical protein